MEDLQNVLWYHQVYLLCKMTICAKQLSLLLVTCPRYALDGETTLLYLLAADGTNKSLVTCLQRIATSRNLVFVARTGSAWLVRLELRVCAPADAQVQFESFYHYYLREW